MMGELLDYDAVANPIYDWGDVAGRSFRMARRITGRDTVLVPAHMSPMRLMEARTLCQPESMANSTKIRFYEWDRETGMVDLEDLKTQARRLLRRRVLGEPELPRDDRGQRRADHRAGALGRSAGHRRRRPHHARRAHAARNPRRRHRLRRHPAAGHAHARRRRLLGLHRLQGRRPGLRPGVPARALHRDGDGHPRPVRRSARRSPTAPATAPATRARTGSARRRACGPSPPPCTWR